MPQNSGNWTWHVYLDSGHLWSCKTPLAKSSARHLAKPLLNFFLCLIIFTFRMANVSELDMTKPLGGYELWTWQVYLASGHLWSCKTPPAKSSARHLSKPLLNVFFVPDYFYFQDGKCVRTWYDEAIGRVWAMATGHDKFTWPVVTSGHAGCQCIGEQREVISLFYF